MPTPDAEIIAEGIFDFKEVSAKAQAKNLVGNIEKQIIEGGSSGENPAITMQSNEKVTIEMINDGINNAIRTAISGSTKLPEKISVVYPDGKVKILTLKEFLNGARF
jgi:hypothetical protein